MCANWVGHNRDRDDMSPDRDGHYQFDDLSLQIGLGLPLQLLGVSLMNGFNRPRENGNRGRGGHRRNQYRQNRNVEIEIQQTCDGIPIRKLYVTNISTETDHSELKRIFVFFGQIKQLYLGLSKHDNRKQFAFITFVNPIDAARVLSQQRIQDSRGRFMYVLPADSWHQPRELPDGTIDWQSSRKTPANDEGSDEDEEQSNEESTSCVETEINEGSLNMLNDDCLLHIFSFLSFKEITAIERVCKRWQALSFRMWRCLHELNFQKDKKFGKMPCDTKVLDQYLKRCGTSLITLDLTAKDHSLGDSTLAVVAKHCNNLEVLRVNNIKVATRSLAHLGRACPRLKQLVMENCDKVSDNDLNTLLPKCPDLQVLELSCIKTLSGKCLPLVRGPVTDLRLSDLPRIDPKYLIQGLNKMSPTLQTLTLNACTNAAHCSLTVSDVVAAVPNLTSFCMSRCTLQNIGLSALGQLKKLTSLNLYLTNAVNDTALSSIVEGCEELTALNIGGSGSSGVLTERGLSMLSRLRKLRHLNISYLEATNSTALKNITARNCKLKSLVCRGCPELNDEGTEPVVTLCNDMELFDLSGCQHVTEKTVQTAQTSVKMRTNNTPLKIIVGGTKVHPMEVDLHTLPLTISFHDFSEDHLRPDFIDDMFFPPSDSDDEDDLDHLCERIAFIFGELYEEDSDFESFNSDSDSNDNYDVIFQFLRSH